MSNATQNLYKGEYHSVGGDATHIIFNFPGYGALYMGSLISLSYQSYRDKTPIYNLGNTNIDGFAIGKRYVAGSIIKTIFLNDDMTNFLQEVAKTLNIKGSVDNINQLKLEKTKTYHHLMMDDILPFDIIIMLSSEYGGFSVSEVIYGATLINSGQVHSINDLIAENTISFVARDVRQTRDKINSIKYGQSLNNDKKASSLQDVANYNNTTSAFSSNDDFYKSKMDEYKSNSVDNGDESLSDFQKRQLAALTQLSGLGATNDYSPSSISSNNGQISEDPMLRKNAATDQTTFNDIDMSTLVYRVAGSNKTAGIDDGDTIEFFDVKTTSGQVFQNMVGTNTGDRSTEHPPGRLIARLSPIDTPEVKHEGQYDEDQPFGQEAREFLRAYMESGKWDKDIQDGVVKVSASKTYGRHVVYNHRYAVEVLENGLAHYSPDLARQNGATAHEMSLMFEAQKRARENKRGLWGAETPPETPSTFRRRMDKKKESIF